ncbi:carbohydrate esterase family 5 protein [Cucurbitaria berberidis CBS 394.84]|uniref:Carbohydrate esterase family 5 protein n=1 Tax=Cucurbitaria berberidis CBS 394.84 TaxID=1168544 RepID=A0A9P4GQ11_9PLEO|nr:carbohydrate esterase family 5 protein [Cucurbitaria berberidis CBS 394.84]KAF1849041.1 carbohydrate esterase family 5 protein [Cucurbitaria berberidis CBS 394.84]
MIPRAAFSALFYASSVLAVCTKLEDCPQYQHLKTAECQTYHHFVARGSTSSYPGHVLETVGKVCNALNTNENSKACGYEDVQYPALNGDKWCSSSHEGAVNGAEQMSNYTARCPDSHLILMGFSQGGSVLLDVLGGGGGELWGCVQEENPKMDITTAPGSKVAAALVFGPTRRSAHQSWTVGGGDAFNGSRPRTSEQLSGLQPYADANLLREYCQPGDPICAPDSGKTDMSNHLSYFDKYSDEAAAWVLDLARKAERGNGSTPDQRSGAGDKLGRSIAHPIANVFILIFVVLVLYFVVRKYASWKASNARLSSYAPVNTTDNV